MRRATRIKAVAAAMTTAVLLAACGSSPQPTPSPSATATPTPSASPSGPPLDLKPILHGLLDRNGAPPLAYVRSLAGFVVNVHWSDLQPAQGGPLAADNAIDQAITTVRNLNATDHLDLGLKLRVLAGVWAPNWAKDIGGAPIQLINPQNSAVGTIGRFWTPGFGQAYDQLESLLAAKYDNVPEVREVNITRCTTFYDEPFIRDSGYQPNDTALLAAGFTMAADETCQREEIDDAAAWQHTHSDLAFNPYEVVNAAGFVSTDEPFTELMMEYCRQVLGIACVLENNSLRDPPLQGYLTMYASMESLGQPLAFQTATAARVGSLANTLGYAVSLGADSVQLPGGYELLGTPASFASTTQALASNLTA